MKKWIIVIVIIVVVIILGSSIPHSLANIFAHITNFFKKIAEFIDGIGVIKRAVN